MGPKSALLARSLIGRGIMPGMVKKVCVIGAGAAGLSAARHLLQPVQVVGESQVTCEPVVFEQGHCVGGTWVYEAKQNGEVHSSMYKSLRTNLPKEVMAFPDFPFPPEVTHSFLHHTEVTR